MSYVDASVGRTETAARLRYLQPGVQLRVSDLTDTLGGYRSRLVEIDERTLWIDLPIRRDGMLSLSPGQLVSVRFDRPGDALYLFDSVVSQRRDDDAAPFGIACPVTINRRPRRTSSRMSLVVDATFEHGGRLHDEAKVVDVSTGGLGLICEHDLAVGSEVRVHCRLPGRDDGVPVDQAATVQTASLFGRTPGGATLHQYGLRFTDVDERTRERILDSIIWNLVADGSG